MKHELDRMIDIIKDYKTGYGGVTDSFMRKELEMFAKDYHNEQCKIVNVVGSFKCRKCGSENIKERSGYKVCFDCGEHH